MITFPTTRFGSLQVREEQIIHFPNGLFGFPDLKRYILLDHKDTEIKWLQAVDDADVAFIVINPFLINPSYQFDIPDAGKELIGLEDINDLAVLVIVRVENNTLLANFHGPIILNSATRLGAQLVVESPSVYAYNIETSSLQK
ncbi:MAG TPA: flagellar assembly protein FliW [Nitrospirae bacterium]|nr:flagellar assembly protein FliW [Nitrospirota bacterium]